MDTWILDMSRCRPAEAISRDGRPGTWAAVDYAIAPGKGDDYFRQLPLLSLDGFPMEEGRLFARPTDG